MKRRRPVAPSSDLAFAWVDLILPALAAALFLALHLRGFGAHSLHPDEGDLLFPMWGLLTQNAELLATSSVVPFFGLAVPILFHPYHGPYEGYISLPFLALFGPTSGAAFVRSAFFDAAVIFLVYVLARRVSGSRAAAACAAFLWATSEIVLGSDFGILWGTAAVAPVLLAAYFFIGWLRTGGWKALLPAAACLGLACATRSWVAAWPIAILICWPLVKGPVRAAWARTPRPRRAAAWAAAAFLAPAVPLLAGDALRGLRIPRVLFSRAHEGVSATLAEAFEQRFRGFLDLLSGHSNRFLLVGNQAIPEALEDTMRPELFACGALLLLAIWLARRRAGRETPPGLYLPAALFAAYFAVSLFSPTNFNLNHLYVALPLLYVQLASLPVYWPGRKGRAVLWVLLGAGALFSAAENARLFAWYQDRAREIGGSGPESSLATEDLARFLAAGGHRNPLVAATVNFRGNLLYLSGGRVVPVELAWGRDPSRPNDPEAWGFYLSEGRVVVTALDPFPERSAAPALRRIVETSGGRLVKFHEIRRRDGVAVYELHRVETAVP